MTLPLEKTLGEVRENVMIRGGIAESAAHNANLQRVVDSFIRDAHHYYYSNNAFPFNKGRASLTLSEGVQEYDWPDDVEPGSISEVRLAGTGATSYKLYPMPSPSEREAVYANGAAGKPRYYEYMDGGITVYPAPSSAYTTIDFIYQPRETQLVADSDRLQVDSNLVMLRATISLLIHRSKPGVGERQRDLGMMEQALLSRNNNRKSINLADGPETPLYGSRYRDRMWGSRHSVRDLGL
jgi:hypothetical protein